MKFFLVLMSAILFAVNNISVVNSCKRQTSAGKVIKIHSDHPDPSPSPTTKISEDLDFKCRDESGEKKDWFIAYKLAKIKDSSNQLVKSGLSYAFLTNGASDKWELSSRSIGSSDSIVGQSLQPLFTFPEGFASTKLFILYNDQPPNRTAASYNGHTKGLIIASATGGIWLQHSVPKFPETTSFRYAYPSSGENNGQMFFCVALSPAGIETIGSTLLHTKPIVFEHTMPPELKKMYPNLAKLVDKKRKPSLAASNLFSIAENGLNITIFAKGPKFEKEIYSDWIAPKLKSNLKVQSWLNGVNSMDSNCTQQYQVFNIEAKKLDRHAFSTKKDHSKWAISDQGKVTCISDLNRMESQKSRGGAAVCITNEKIWESFDKAVIDVEPCKRPRQI